MIYTDSDGIFNGEECNAHMKYENSLHHAETRSGFVGGVDGEIEAVRKSLYRPVKSDQVPEFFLPSKVLEQKYRVI